MHAALPTDTQTPETRAGRAGAVTGTVAIILRLEAAAALVGAILAYRLTGGGWVLFAALFLVPDICMLGYLIGPRQGAWTYNLGHTYLAPALLGLAALILSMPGLYSLAIIWIAHIAFDRLLGFGLKYPAAFGATHLRKVTA